MPTWQLEYVGISDTPAWVIAQANTLAELRGWSRFVGLQFQFIGARTVAQFQDNLVCLEFTLSEAQLVRLSEVSHIALGFPYDFLASDGVRDLVYGGTFSLVDNHHQ